MYFLATAAWLVFLIVAFIKDRRSWALISLVLGAAIQYGIWFHALGFLGVAGLGVLCLITIFMVPEIFIPGYR